MTSRTALITGGTSGIGRATALLLRDRGFEVMVTGSTDESVAAAQEDFGDDIIAIRCDARSLLDLPRVAEEVETRFGSLDALFLNAGISAMVPVADVQESAWDEAFAINTKGQFFLFQSVLPFLAAQASVVFTVGVGVQRGIAGGSVVAASRGALLGMVPSLAMELAPRRIRVNAVSPGVVATPIWAKVGLPQDAVDGLLAQQAQRIPLGRVGEARDVAETVAFLVSESAQYVTGQHIVVGGGIDIAG